MFFESISGLTTTGATVFTGLDEMPIHFVLHSFYSGSRVWELLF